MLNATFESACDKLILCPPVKVNNLACVLAINNRIPVEVLFDTCLFGQMR
jgi:hypothetical protein